MYACVCACVRVRQWPVASVCASVSVYVKRLACEGLLSPSVLSHGLSRRAPRRILARNWAAGPGGRLRQPRPCHVGQRRPWRPWRHWRRWEAVGDVAVAGCWTAMSRCAQGFRIHHIRIHPSFSAFVDGDGGRDGGTGTNKQAGLHCAATCNCPSMNDPKNQVASRILNMYKARSAVARSTTSLSWARLYLPFLPLLSCLHLAFGVPWLLLIPQSGCGLLNVCSLIL